MRYIPAIVLAFIIILVVVPCLYSFKKYMQRKQITIERNIEIDKFDKISSILVPNAK